MIKILYDFNIKDLDKSTFYNPKTGNKEELSSLYKSNLLKNHDSLFSYQYLGGGTDSICFVESDNQSFYIVEPANGLIVASHLIQGLIKFEEKRKNVNDLFEFSFGSLMDETFFRSHRNDDEFNIIGKVINYEKIEDNYIVLKYPNSSFEWKCNYLEFVIELLHFGEKVFHLYDYILSDFKEYRLYNQIQQLLTENNLLRQKYMHLLLNDNLGKSFLDFIHRDLLEAEP